MTLTQLIRPLFITILLLTSTLQSAHLQPASKEILIEITSVLLNLLQDEDTDGDQKITVNDFHIQGTEHGDKKFLFTTVDHSQYEVAGVYYLSNLLQELHLLHEKGILYQVHCISMLNRSITVQVLRRMQDCSLINRNRSDFFLPHTGHSLVKSPMILLHFFGDQSLQYSTPTMNHLSLFHPSLGLSPQTSI